MDREQIVKALVMFIDDMPTELHFGFARTVRFRKLLQDTLALIRELTEENESLRDKLTETEIPFEKALDSVKWLESKIESLKADTVRDMQERFNQVFGSMDATNALLRRTFDQIAKEMLEEDT